MTDQPHSRTPDEMAVARAIGDFTEHQAGIPPRLKALAVNAVGPALQARGDWLRLSTRQAVAVAVLVAVKAELEASSDGPDAPQLRDQHPDLHQRLGDAYCQWSLDVEEHQRIHGPTSLGPDGAEYQLRAIQPELDALEQSRSEANAWRHKAIRRALGTAKLHGALNGCRDLIGEEITRTDEWGDGYREAIGDLREVLAAFGQLEPAHDGPTVAELAANDRNWDVEKEGE